MTLLIVVVGLSGLAAQVMLMRELLVSFYGNELTLGIILANWVAAEAAGVFLFGRAVDRARDPWALFAALQAGFCISLAACLYFARAFKTLIGVPPGEGIGLFIICAASMCIVFPAAFAHGGLFSALCSLDGRRARTAGRVFEPVGRVYAWEILGSVAGGLLVTWVFIPCLRTFQTASVLIVANCAVSALFLLRQGGQRNAVAGVLVIAAMANGSVFQRLEQSSLRRQYPAGMLLDARTSVFGSLAVTRQMEQYTFYVNGLPVITSPHPDAAFAEDFIHLPMLMHEGPKDALMLGAGAGGFLRELLRHPLASVDYVELDPTIIRLLREYPTPATEKELDDPRLRVHSLDGRYFLRRGARSYDACFIGFSRPSDLAVNRFYTTEFFRLLRRHIKPKGIVAVSLPGSLTHIGPELAELNGMMLRTLRASFGSVRVIPGDVNIYVASDDPRIAALSAKELAARAGSSGIPYAFVSAPYVEYRLGRDIEEWFARNVPHEGPLNADTKPRAVFTMNLFWNKEFSPRAYAVMKALDGGRPRTAAAAVIIGMALCAGYLACRRRRTAALAWVIGSSGFYGMLAGLILVFAFQSHFGYLYRYMGILIGLFMAGSAAGSFAMTRLLRSRKPGWGMLSVCELCVIVFAAALMLLLGAMESAGACAGAIFCALFVIAGFLLGAEFPLAAGLYAAGTARAGETSGFLYFMDLAGGWAAGMLGGVVMVPLLGVGGSCLAVILLKSGSLIGLLRERQDTDRAGAGRQR